MSQLTERLALAVFTVLSGALATNMFLLQPPARRGMTGPEDRIQAMRQEGVPTGAISEPAASAPPAAPAPPAATSDTKPAEPALSTTETKPPDAAATTPTQASSPASPAVTPTEQNPLKIAPPSVTASPEVVKAVQRELRLKGYETGGEDGVLTLVTRAAIMAYEADQKLPLTAEPTQDLLTQIILGETGGVGAHAASADLTPQAQDVVRNVQSELKRAGFDPGSEDGRLSDQTLSAIRSFETSEHLPEKGRISGELIGKLKSVPSKQASR